MIPERPTPDPDDPVEAREREFLQSIAAHERHEAAGAPLEVCVTEQQGVPVITVTGELDVYTAGALQERLAAVCAAEPSGVVVDLSRASYIDSTGLAALVRAAHQLGGALAVVTQQERVARLFRATGLTQAIALHHSLPEAVAAMAE